jgi:hypothetical protein
VISKGDVAKVLTICRVGQRCVVRGLVDYSKDSGECVEMSGVELVRRKQ